MKSATQIIPESLIYEMIDGKPIYFNGYKQYLNGEKEIEELMGSSYLQSLIITNLVLYLGNLLPKKYQLLTNEIGLQFAKKTWRAADVAIVEKSKLQKSDLSNKYLAKAPKIVIEIDTKANLEEAEDTFGYFHKKTDQLLAFGVEKVIWIFTASEKVMIATKEKNWETQSWKKDVLVLDDIAFNVESLIKE